MKRANLYIIVLALSILMAACSREKKESEWHPDVQQLDALARRDPEGARLAHDVEIFYQNLRDKKWHETYEGRAKAFREDMLESEYLRYAKKYENQWGLVNYEVLSGELHGSDVAVFICKFTELPDYTDSYSAVFWHKEDGVWKCLSAGPKKLSIFDGTRPPIIDWR